MNQPSLPKFSQKKHTAYAVAGAGLLAIGTTCAILNFALNVPEYQKLSWLLIAFFFSSGVLALGSGLRSTAILWWGGLGLVVAGAVTLNFSLIQSSFDLYKFFVCAMFLVPAALATHLSKKSLPGIDKIVEYTEALIVAVLLAVVIRGTVVQAFKIPSGSMLPTLQIGDHLLVTKFLYGVRLPYTDKRVCRVRAPKRGDVVVFAYPGDDSLDFIKRIIGEPGDMVEVREGVVFINGEQIDDPWGKHMDRFGKPTFATSPGRNYGPETVPEGQYLMLGDNRNNSQDSRYWGFVDEARIRGKAFILYWSWDSDKTWPRFDRIANLIK